MLDDEAALLADICFALRGLDPWPPYVAAHLCGRCRATRFASRFRVRGDLEYADEVTLGRALTGKREM